VAVASNNPFVGVWRLVSCEAIRRNGGTVALYGPNPVGRLYYDAGGNMSVHIMRGDRTPRRSEGKSSTDSDEVRAAFEGYQAYFSTYVVEAERRLIHHQVVGSLYPKWTGTIQTRSYEFLGANRLVLSSAVDGNGSNSRTVVKLVWERLEPREA
jgi:translation initiation factor RLI1